MIVFVGVVLLVVGEEGVELEALLEVLGGLEATDVLEHVEVAVGVGAGLDETVPVDALELDVGVVLLNSKFMKKLKLMYGLLMQWAFSRAITNWLKSNISGKTFILDKSLSN